MSTFDPGYTSALQQIQFEASGAFHRALAKPEAPASLIRETWHALTGLSHNAHARGHHEDQLALAKQARSIMTELEALTLSHARALAAPEQFRAAGGGMNYDPAAVAAAFEAAVSKCPELSKFMGERAAAEAERQQRAAEAAAAAEAQRQRDLPGNLLVSLRRRGVELKLTGDGVGATRAHLAMMQQSEIETIKQRRTDILKLLYDEVRERELVQIT